MSREIKFRNWNKEVKFMTVPYTLDFTLRYNEVPSDADGSQVVFMQYTGINDMKGNEVYEGDIVKYGGRIGRIEWHKEQASFDLIYIKTVDQDAEVRPLSNHHWRLKVEVIGNIYENKELWK